MRRIGFDALRRRWGLIAAAALVLALALIAAGCGGGSSSTSAESESTTAESSAAAESEPAAEESESAPAGEAEASTPFEGPTSALKPYDPSMPAGEAPESMAKVVAFANQTDTGFFLDLQNGIKDAVEGEGWEFLSANAEGDAATNLNQVNDFLQRGVGILVTAPVGGNLAPPQEQAMEKGTGVFSFLSGPAVSVASTDQCQVGQTQGEDAAKFINEEMNGEAQVVYINANRLSPALIPRDKCAIKALEQGGPGIEIAADEYNVPGVASGNELMTTILQAHPDVSVVLGDDESVLGALQAIRAAGKESQVKYMSGVNGSEDALAEVEKGESPYMTDYAFGFGPLGYAWGRNAVEYSEGKSIPMVLDLNPIALSSKADIDKFEADTKTPEKADLDNYLTQLGNISWATRGAYVNYAP